MAERLSNFWTRLLNIGSTPTMDHLQLMRLHLINGLVSIGVAATLFYVVIFTLLGTVKALEGLAVIPVLAIVILLNHARRYNAARVVIIHVTQLVVFVLALIDRRTGTEYILLVLAISSIIVFEKRASVVAGFMSNALLYLAYIVIDRRLPFVPDAHTPYFLVNNALILLCGVWMASLLLLFRTTAFKYAADLREAAAEIAAMNTSLQSSNQQLFARTEDLDLAVRRKTIDLQIHKRAIDEHLMSMTTDRKGLILSINKKALDIMGYSLEQVIGKDVRELDPESDPVLMAELAAALQTGKPYRSEVRAVTSTGSRLWIDMLAIPVVGPEGEFEHILYLSTLISERKAYEIMQARALVGLEAIAHRTSHEIRGPLARILGLSQLLERGLIKPEELSDIANKMSISANELNTATSALTIFIQEHERQLVDKIS